MISLGPTSVTCPQVDSWPNFVIGFQKGCNNKRKQRAWQQVECWVSIASEIKRMNRELDHKSVSLSPFNFWDDGMKKNHFVHFGLHHSSVAYEADKYSKKQKKNIELNYRRTRQLLKCIFLVYVAHKTKDWCFSSATHATSFVSSGFPASFVLWFLFHAATFQSREMRLSQLLSCILIREIECFRIGTLSHTAKT